MRSLAVALLLVLAPVAAAQPMMMDPSKMSGIPRPDPQVPAGTITVRLIRGQLTNRVVGTEVTLVGADGKEQKQKTDAEGRATFVGLVGEGPYLATAKDGESELKSQPIALSPQMGSRVMLVFAQGGLGAPDGKAHADKALPAGTLVVRAEDAAGQAVEGLVVELGQQSAASEKIVEHKATTDVAGEAKFTGLEHTPTSGYAARIVAKGGTFPSEPFKLEANIGSRLVILVREVSQDAAALSLAEGSHILLEVTDDALQVIEVFRLNNGSTRAFDAGPEGLHLPLPRNAVQIQAADGNPAVAIAGKDLVYRGTLPPGDTQLRVGFVIPYHGPTAELVQPTPIPFMRLAVVTQQLEGLTLNGHGLRGQEREMQGRKLIVYFGDATDRGGELRIEVAGLPHANATPRWVAAGLALGIVLVLGIYAWGGGGAARMRLERQRQSLFEQIVSLDGKLGASSAAARAELEKERVVLVDRLAEVYRGLDELGGG